MSATSSEFQSYRFDSFTLDTGRGALLKEGLEIKLRRQSFEVLKLLVANAGILVSREQLQQAIWGDQVVTDDSLAQCLIDVRKALGDSDRKIVRTVPRRGYIFEAVVTESARPTTQASTAALGGRSRLLIAGLAAAVVVAILAAIRFGTGVDSQTPPPPPAKSIAVLPFLDMSQEQNQTYFGDGLAEEILNSLARTPDLLVTARTSSFALRDSKDDVPTIAAALGVKHVLEGSVRKDGERLRVTAQLIRAEDGMHLWSQSYDRTPNDVITIQEEIAIEIANALQTVMDPEALGKAMAVGTRSVALFESYLRGLEQQAIGSNDSLANAERLFERILEQDPGFTAAALALVRTRSYLRHKLWPGRPRINEDTGQILETILAREPNNLEAQGLSLLFQADRSLRQTIAPQSQTMLVDQLVAHLSRGFGDSFVRRIMVGYLSAWDRSDEALTLLQGGLAVDPLNVDLLLAQATLLSHNNRHEEAIQPLLFARNLAPHNPDVLWQLAMTNFDAGETVAGLDWARQAAELDTDDPALSGNLALRFYDMGFTKAGDYWRQRALDADPNQRGTALMLSMNAAVARGDGDDLLKLAKEIIDEGLGTQANTGLPVALAVWLYSVEMHNRGLSREALDYLVGREPRFAEHEWLPSEINIWRLKGFSHFLWADVLTPAEFDRRSRAYMQAAETLGIDTIPAPPFQVVTAMWSGNDEQAKAILLENLRDYPLDEGHWRPILQNPWLEELHDDPKVANRFAQVIVARERVRDEVQQMLLRPEWLSHQ